MCIYSVYFLFKIMSIFGKETESCLCFKMLTLWYLQPHFSKFCDRLLQDPGLQLYSIITIITITKLLTKKLMLLYMPHNDLWVWIFNKVTEKLPGKKYSGTIINSYETINLCTSSFSEVWDLKFIIFSYYKKDKYSVLKDLYSSQKYFKFG